MNDAARQSLIQIIARHGAELASDPRRCEGLLRDFCGQHRKEINILVSAVKEKITADLITLSSSVPYQILVVRLTRKLHEGTGIAEDLARWSVESWALALRINAQTDGAAAATQRVAPQVQEQQRLADNLHTWRSSGHPRTWVESHQGSWSHLDWLALLDMLHQSPCWPMDPAAVGKLLEETKAEWLAEKEKAAAARKAEYERQLLEEWHRQAEEQKRLAEQKRREEQRRDEHFWQSAQHVGTIAAYKGYLAAMPSGWYVSQAQNIIQRLTQEEDDRAWQSARREDSLDAYERYLSAWPHGTHVAQAREAAQRIEDERAWLLALRTDTLAEYEYYLNTYPNGMHVAEARDAVSGLLRDRLLAEIDNPKLRLRYLEVRSLADAERDRRSIPLLWRLLYFWAWISMGAIVSLMSNLICNTVGDWLGWWRFIVVPLQGLGGFLFGAIAGGMVTLLIRPRAGKPNPLFFILFGMIGLVAAVIATPLAGMIACALLILPFGILSSEAERIGPLPLSAYFLAPSKRTWLFFAWALMGTLVGLASGAIGSAIADWLSWWWWIFRAPVQAVVGLLGGLVGGLAIFIVLPPSEGSSSTSEKDKPATAREAGCGLSVGFALLGGLIASSFAAAVAIAALASVFGLLSCIGDEHEKIDLPTDGEFKHEMLAKVYLGSEDD